MAVSLRLSWPESVSSAKRLKELLNDDQEVAWKKLTGEPFKGDLAFFDATAAK